MSINFDVKNNINFGAYIATIPMTKGIKTNKVSLSNLKMQGLTALIGGDVFECSGKIKKHDLLFMGKKLLAIDEFNPDILQSPVNYVYIANKTLTPVIFDEHTHMINIEKEADIRAYLRQIKAEGTGAILATTLPDKISNIKNRIKVLNNIIKYPNEDEARILGIHLEGPFLSPLKPGIHNKDDLLLPTVDNFLAMEPENVRMVTLAPELDKNFELTNYLLKSGIIPSAGHTMATAGDIQKSGITHITHLFNAMAPLHHRTPTVANEALFNPDIAVEVIAEQSHIDSSVKDLIMREKPADKIILVSDAIFCPGKEKNFIMGGKRISVDENWIARDEAGTLAGSVRFLHDLAGELINRTRMSFEDFIRFASVNPAKSLRLEDKFELKVGQSPNFTIWNNTTLTPEKSL